jgi:hypothetical protein
LTFGVPDMSLAINQYDRVRVVQIRDNRFDDTNVWFARRPVVGDLGYVLEVYEGRDGVEGGYEIECSDPSTGETLWLDVMFENELEFDAP